MRPWLAHSLLVALAFSVAWLVWETRSLAELAGRQEIEARRAAAVAATAEAALAQHQDVHAAALGNVARLEAELAATHAQLATMAELLRERTEQTLRVAAEAEAAAARAMQPMPEGVRLCLQALHACLRAEGYTGQRFLSARHLDGEGLHEVEMLDAHDDGLGVAFVQAARMVADLDRGAGRLTLRFYDGTRTERGERSTLAADGWPIVFAPIDARLFEERLPFLVRATGVYPGEVAARRARAPTDVDPVTRLQWLERFDRLLDLAGTPELLRVNRFRGMADGCFLTVQLLGTDQKFHLLLSADCERLAVEVDEAAGVVSLLLRNGVLRRGGVESTISAEGYRMLLPKLTPKQAADAMLGMVVKK